ncbi:MAG: glycoside hydrolase family 20 zincin-like fold domain-containing protein [Lentisphaeria bacterium]|nr:glycoside hydrolase family 20 zincin-like fold domain-containing protein [Lentisphaeria bacterium]
MCPTTEQPQLPFFIPTPQSIELLEGATELSPDVRLATSNVIPYMRKTMRSIFTAAAIRVVANKKRFVIHVNIVGEDEADWEDVPPRSRDDFYKMKIENNVVVISSPSQTGAIWGVQSFADIYQAQGPDSLIPNCVIRDWPTTPVRGAAVPATAMSKRMRLEEYGTVIDRLARSRMNTLIVGLYNPPRPDCDRAETLLVPFPEFPELVTEDALTWETAQIAPVPEGTYDAMPPVMVSDDYLAGLISYGHERGLQVIPSLDLSDMTPLLKRVCPAAGKVDDSTYRDCAESLYGSLLTRYCPDGISAFHISLANLDRSLSADYAAWLVEILTAKGVETVIIDAAAATADMVKALQKNGFLDKVIFLGDTDVTGVASWRALPLDAADWRGFGADEPPALPELPTDGVIALTSIDSSRVFEEYLIAVTGWNAGDAENMEACKDRAVNNIAGRFYDVFKSALPELRQACAAMPEILSCVPVNAPDGGQAWIKDVEAALGSDPVARLDAVIAPARAAYKKLLPMVTTEGESTPFPTVTKTFIGEAVRMLGVALACKVAIQGKPEEGMSMDDTIEAFTEYMQGVSSFKPRHMSPPLLSGLTMLRNHLKSMA